MFITHEAYLDSEPDSLGPDRTAWRMVEFESVDPCYYVTVRFYEGIKHRTKKMMPANVSMLSDVLATQDPTLSVEEVQVVTSPRLNGSNSERMEKLISLFVGYDQNGEPVLLLHKVASGAVYSSAADILDARSVIDIRMIYEDMQIAHPSAQECAEH
ncbi:hypothetical protein ACYZT8_03110 [Pseudomonas sp. LB3P93]